MINHRAYIYAAKRKMSDCENMYVDALCNSTMSGWVRRYTATTALSRGNHNIISVMK